VPSHRMMEGRTMKPVEAFIEDSGLASAMWQALRAIKPNLMTKFSPIERRAEQAAIEQILENIESLDIDPAVITAIRERDEREDKTMPHENQIITMEHMPRDIAWNQFQGEVTMRHMDHPGGEVAPSALDPQSFYDVDPMQARYIGTTIKSDALPVPIFFGIRLEGDREFLCAQADEIVKGLLYQVSSVNHDAAAVGFGGTAYMHDNVQTLDAMHRQSHNTAHPYIDPNLLPLFEQLSAAIKTTAVAFINNGRESAYTVWQQNLSSVKNGVAIEGYSVEPDVPPRVINTPLPSGFIPPSRQGPD